MLAPMNHQELQDVIEEPAKILGVKFESGLVERILEAVEKEPGNLPLLEFALKQLWEKQQNGYITHQAYEEIGGVEKALAVYAEEEYEKLSEDDKQKAQRMFIQLVRPGEKTEDTRRIATLVEVGDDNWKLATRLADSRLVVTGRDETSDIQTVEVVHEALIQEWTTLRQWINANRDFRIWQERLKGRMYEWEDNNKDEGSLLRGLPLAEAKDWLHKRGDELSNNERNFIEQSIALLKKEREQQQRRRRFTILGLTSFLAVAMTLAGIIGYQLWRTSIAETNARLRALAATSEALFNSDLKYDALAKSIKAGQQLKQANWVNVDTRIQVIATLSQVLYGQDHKAPTTLKSHSSKFNNVSFSPDGKSIASASADKTVKLWDVTTGKEIKALKGHLEEVYSVSFSPDGKTIASASWDKTVKLWDVSTGKQIKTLKGHSNSVYSVSFSPDGKTIASASYDKTVKLWDVTTGKQIKTFKGHSSRVDSVSFSPDGKTIASASYDKTVKLWDVNTGKQIKTLQGHSDWVFSVSFSPDGKSIASASDDKTSRGDKHPETLLSQGF
ncbi:WD-40 repeat-containing protein (plasmid) [Calothrix parasitica NIES-267]|uniref:WD-40 repeat-containing protein n=1 Tax=Calothrix parasitica NIES-267 TaxID=1973488 RepID=A0A1Z4M2L5_9CYAN|nr:WD-40 repeat-containing protein [Calothrix parasitica NIES-267]